jgi:hypothetical protein
MSNDGAHRNMPAAHEPKATRTAPESRARAKSHVQPGMHFVVHGPNKGSCMCTEPCCLDPERGCICRSCSGIGHSNCRAEREARDHARDLRESRKRRAAARG